MGNTHQKTSGELKNKNGDDNVMVKKLQQPLQLFKDSPVFTMFSVFINKVEQQVQLFKVNHVFSKFGNWQTGHPPQKLQAEKKDTNSLVLWQVNLLFIFF